MRLNRLTAFFVSCLASIFALTVCSQQGAEVKEAESAEKVVHKGTRPSQGGDILEFVHLDSGGFPLNINPEIVAAKDAPIEDSDMVMGIVIEGEVRAYPVNYMNGPHNEVVNDKLGGRAIAPSW